MTLAIATRWKSWQDGRLVGGLYGVALNGAFFGESMFSVARDASKVALTYLCARLIHGGFSLLDTQFVTEHLKQFGAIEIGRPEFHLQLERALAHGADFSLMPQNTGPQRSSAVLPAEPGPCARRQRGTRRRGGGASPGGGAASGAGPLAAGARRGCEQPVSHTSNTGWTSGFRPGLSANIQPLKICFSLPSNRISSTSTKVEVLGGSLGSRV